MTRRPSPLFDTAPRPGTYFRMQVAELMEFAGFEWQHLNSREWRMVDKMRRAGRSVEYAATVARRANQMRKAKANGQEN